jgi:hypothetical protein
MGVIAISRSFSMQTRSVLLAAAIAFLVAQPVHGQQTNYPMAGM